VASRSPGKRNPTERSAAERGRIFLKMLKELGEQPGLADAVEAAYREEHGKLTYGHEGD
jgi:hypothetical protein